MPAKPGFDPIALQQLQLNDLKTLADSAKVGKVAFKELKTETKRAPEPGTIFRAGNIYFFHPDHLGTATYLTDIKRKYLPVFLNLPFGETMVEQHSLSENYDNPFKFNGKELDEETGLYYYGARYYDPRVSIWLSVDPLAESFPNWNPYNYCLQNPINLIDPDGRSASPIFDMDGNFLGTDENGYSGTLIFMMEEHYNALKDVGENGKMNHQLELSVGSTLSQVIGDSSRETFSDKDINMINSHNTCRFTNGP